MRETYQTVFQGGIGEIVEKKSKFIATVSGVESEAAAIDFIEGIKKKYWDASHNCSAYIIGAENSLMRCSDDGEPSQTAGKPMLDVLVSHELTNIVVVVTRYFGGTLLGTGGLVRAYQGATKEGLSQSVLITKELGINLLITTDYNSIGKIQYLIGHEMLHIMASDYSDIVKLTVLVPLEKKASFEKQITDITSGMVKLDELEQVYFASIDNELHLFS